MKTIALGISDFAVPAPRTGSLEAYSGYGALPNLGAEIHAQIQESRRRENPGYQAEKWITHAFAHEGYRIQVSGRIDGICYGNPTLIEEIKSAYNTRELLRALAANPDHPYRLQARTYAYLHYRATLEIPQIQLLIVSARERGQQIEFPLELQPELYEEWLKRRLAEIVSEAKLFEALRKRRRKQAKEFIFPFHEPRQGQIELMQTVENNLNKNPRLLLQAPTGLGKTAGVMFPALKEALQRGQKVIYLTPKNSQHAVAEDAVKRLQKAGTKVRSLTIQAKGKMCLKEQVLCNPDYCEFARDYYRKMAEKQLVDQLAKKKNLSASRVQKFAREHEVCPFELQMESISRADVVICDYNYVFSPRNSLGRLTFNGFGEKKSAPNLVIDESHNLPQRAADYFSATLSTAQLRELQKGFQHLGQEVYSQAQDLMHDTLDFISGASSSPRPARVEIRGEEFFKLNARAGELLARYLESPEKLQPGDTVVAFCNLLADFAQALENVDDEFFCTSTPGVRGAQLKVTCCDASKWLKESYTAFANVVAFSATVKPFEYYTKLLGLSEPLTAEFSSPFPRERRKILIVPQVSTKYSDREANYGKISEGIQRILQIKPGNYFVFFPSFDFLGRVAALLKLPEFDVIAQTREMKRQDVESYLDALKRPEQPTLILAVQGGVFAEGLDYPGEMLIGAIIVGPALPTFDFERELLRAHFEKKHGEERGFDYAYTYPAMAKVVQSAGRVIRSHEDRGLIVLMDRRFLQNNYVKSMPIDWVGDEPHAHVSTSLLSDIKRFWDENAPA